LQVHVLEREQQQQQQTKLEEEETDTASLSRWNRVLKLRDSANKTQCSVHCRRFNGGIGKEFYSTMDARQGHLTQSIHEINWDAALLNYQGHHTVDHS